MKSVLSLSKLKWPFISFIYSISTSIGFYIFLRFDFTSAHLQLNALLVHKNDYEGFLCANHAQCN